MQIVRKIVVTIALLPVYLYRWTISPLIGGCTFNPTCSSYCLIAVRRHGVMKGYWLGVMRLWRCKPWGKKNGGYDPVPWGYKGGAKFVI